MVEEVQFRFVQWNELNQYQGDTLDLQPNEMNLLLEKFLNWR